MKVGIVVSVKYATGESFVGEVVKVKTMPDMSILFTLKTEIEGQVAYRSMYLHKCEKCEYLGYAGV